MTAVGCNVKDPARLCAVAARAPHNAWGSQDRSHRRTLDSCHVSGKLVAHARGRFEQALGGEFFHEGGEREGNRERRSGHGLVKYRVCAVGIGLSHHPFDCPGSTHRMRTRAERTEGAG